MLKAFGRSRERTALIADLADGHRRETMGVLRIAFLSALALELAATISVAVVAVAVGLRVLEGVLDLEPALTVLVLAPEAYVPLRRVAGEFHSAAEGVEAAGRIFEMSPDPASDPAESPPGASAPIGRPPRITLEGLEVHRRGSAALRGLSIDIEAGSWLALTGPSGSGKSTLLAAVLGLAPLHRGRIVVDGEDVGEDLGRWRGRIGWVPQDPHLFPGSIAANVRFGLPGADDDDIETALRLAACDFVFALPEGAATEIGERGSLLSAGERGRVALARALVRRPDVLILDEPTAHLDALTEAAVLDAVARLRPAVTIIVAAHRPEAARRADRIVALGDPARGEECR
jgi:ABC-type transport system involved in cytochrome bd biosynthesis fused ATPase/permease subunit